MYSISIDFLVIHHIFFRLGRVRQVLLEVVEHGLEDAYSDRMRMQQFLTPNDRSRKSL